jgi:hypothetical protein
MYTHSPARCFSPLTDSFYISGQLFSDLASENSEAGLLASLARILKNFHTPDSGHLYVLVYSVIVDLHRPPWCLI